MKVFSTAIPDVKVIEPDCYMDARGFFFESFNAQRYATEAGIKAEFVQDNHSSSARGVLRGLHYQLHHPQGKLVRVVTGAVFDVAVDLRQGAATFARWVGIELSAENRHQLWIPPGFAHGFMVLSESCDFLYKATDYYRPEDEHCVAWNDAELAIEWPLQGINLAVSARDSAGLRFSAAAHYP